MTQRDFTAENSARYLITCLREGRDPHTIPRESLRTPSHGVVAGWVIINGPLKAFTITTPDRRHLELGREELVKLLRAQWMHAAAVAIGDAVDDVEVQP